MATVSRNNTAEPGDRRARAGSRRQSTAPDTASVAPEPARVAEEAAAIYPDTSPAAPTPDEIAAEAYLIYSARGGDHGRDMDDWLEAERRLSARRHSASKQDIDPQQRN